MPLTFYKSSAGSGKTETLARAYLKIVLERPEEFKNILAVTFTNKAAEEMRTRIIKRLAELSENGGTTELEKYLRDSGINVNIKENAKLALQLILHNYSLFSVGTIDSFFHKIFRSFARELKQKLGYEVLLEEEEALAKAVDDLFADIGLDKELTDYLRDYAFYNIDEDKGWGINYSIKKNGAEIFRERYRQLRGKGLSAERKNVAQFIVKLRSIIEDFEKKLTGLRQEGISQIEKFGLNISDFSYGKAGFAAYFYNWNDSPNSPGLRFRDVIKGKNPCPPGSLNKKQVIECMDSGLKNISQRILEHFDKNGRIYFTAAHLIKTIFTLGLFRDIQDKLKFYRDQNHVVLISDISDLLKNIIQDNPAPFLFERVGLRYKYFLIDEFQDTSEVQWINFLPLIINSLAEKNYSIIVGDVKQSIFRWRNGDMKLLLQNAEKSLVNFEGEVNSVKLTENWRSRKNIIDFNNKFFPEAARLISSKLKTINNTFVERVYLESTQTASRRTEEGGYVKIEFIESNDRQDEPELNKLLDTITELENDGFDLKDIMILVRENKEGRKIAEFLNENDKPVISSESLLVTSSPQVRFLMSMMRYLANPLNKLAAYEAEFQYEAYLVPEPSSIPPLKGARGMTDPERNAILDLPLYDAVETLVRKFGLNLDANAYLIKFLELVLDYSVKHSPVISSFLNWWDEQKQEGEKFSVAVPDEENAVQIMTIHKAKGLERPVIIIPYANWKLDWGGLMWVDSKTPFDSLPAYLVHGGKSLENTVFDTQFSEDYLLTHVDNLNLLYVSFTRPIERLYVTSRGKHRSELGKINSAGDLIRHVIAVPELIKYYDKEKKVFESGSTVKSPPRSNKNENGNLTLKNIISEDVSKKAILRRSPTPLAVFNPELMDEETPDGVLFHYAMSLITVKEDLDECINVLLNKGFVTETAAASLRKFIENAVSFPEASDWFAGKWKVIMEKDLLCPDGEILRPDRIMQNDSRTVIVDYKTGAEKDEYKKQITKYADVLEKAVSLKPEKYIYYVKSKKILSF